MVHRDTPWPPGTPCWAELVTPDPARAANFYADLFGWRDGTLDGRVVADIRSDVSAGLEPAWRTYLAVADTAAASAAVIAAGGRHLGGDLAVDPLGATFGVRAGRGLEVVNEPGALVWNELAVADLAAAKAFYTSVFGYTYRDLPDYGQGYAMFEVAGATAGGFAVADGPARWLTFFEVANADDAVARVRALGGTVGRAARDTEYGRLAVVADDQGAVFAVIQG